MTKEDQVLVTKAALAGVRFFRDKHGHWCFTLPIDRTRGSLTIGRAAALALWYMGLTTEDELQAYEQTTDPLDGPQDVDIGLLQVIATDAPLPDAPLDVNAAQAANLPPR